MTGDFDHSIVESTAHRPWPMPRAPWLMTQSWHDLLFAHWRVDVSEVRRAVPAAFDLDLFDGEAWLGVVPFYMTNVGLRATPALPWISTFRRTQCSDLRPSGGSARRLLLQPRRRPLAGGRGGAGVSQSALLRSRHDGRASSRRPALRKRASNARAGGVQGDLRTHGRPLRRVHRFDRGTSSRSDTACTITIVGVIRTAWTFTTGRGPCRSRARRSR